MDEVMVGVYATQFIVIKLGEEQYGIDIKYINNIVRMQHITRVPKVSSYIRGVINLRGEVIPVMSIRIMMGLDMDEITKNSRIIILKLDPNSHDTVGIIVDEVKEVVTLNSDNIENVSYDSKDEQTHFITGIGKHNDELISLLDLHAVINENENM